MNVNKGHTSCTFKLFPLERGKRPLRRMYRAEKGTRFCEADVTRLRETVMAELAKYKLETRYRMVRVRPNEFNVVPVEEECPAA